MPELPLELRTSFGAYIRDAELEYAEGAVPDELCAFGERVFKRKFGEHRGDGHRAEYWEFPIRQVRVRQ